MRLFSVALAMTAFLVGPARADGMPDVGPGQAACEKDGPRCVVLREDIVKQNGKLMEAATALRAQEDVITLLEAELKKVRAIKGCAKLEVLPKPTLPSARGG